MSRSLSLRDLQQLPEFAGMNEVMMIHPSNDDLMKQVLEKLAFDIDQPVLFVPSVHRDMSNKVALGFRVVGEISLKEKWRNSGLLDVTERLVVAGRSDLSLMKDMAELTGKSRNYNPDGQSDSSEDEFMIEDQLEPNRGEVEKQIQQLADIRDILRGSCYNAAGSLKTFEEYKETTK